MTQVEFERWQQFYLQSPFDDLHRFHRPAALVAASFSGKLEEKLEWLCPPRADDEYTDADLKTFRAFGLKPPRD